MLSFDKNFLFIHSPKTGGTSLKYLLKDYEERELFDKYQSVFFDELKTQNWKTMATRLEKSLTSFDGDMWRDNILKKFDKEFVDIDGDGEAKDLLFAYEQKLKPAYHKKMTLLNPNDNGYYHLAYNHYKQLLNTEVFEQLVKFSIVRNPFDRAISLYFWNNGGSEIDMEKFIECVEVLSPVFYNPWNPVTWWVCDANLEQVNKDTEDKDGHKKNIVIVDPASTVDFILKFEDNLNNRTVYNLCNQLGINYQPLQHLNASHSRKHYSAYYDSEMRALVEKHYKCDLDAFNYDFDKK